MFYNLLDAIFFVRISRHGLCPLDQVAKVYELVVEVGVHRAPCIKVAEAAKINEN